MNRIGIETLSKALMLCLQLTFAAGLVITAFLGPILKYCFGWYFWEDNRYYLACIILLTPCGLCSLNILWQLVRMLKTINNKNPFVPENVRGLRRIAVSAFIISALFFALAYVKLTILTVAIGYISLIAGFCFVVLAGIFSKAVEYKDENDLTV